MFRGLFILQDTQLYTQHDLNLKNVWTGASIVLLSVKSVNQV